MSSTSSETTTPTKAPMCFRLAQYQRNLHALHARRGLLRRHRVDQRTGRQPQRPHRLLRDPAPIDVHQQLDEAFGQHDAPVGDGQRHHQLQVAVGNGRIEESPLHLERRGVEGKDDDRQRRNPDLAPGTDPPDEPEKCRRHALERQRPREVVGRGCPPWAASDSHSNPAQRGDRQLPPCLTLLHAAPVCRGAQNHYPTARPPPTGPNPGRIRGIDG